MAFSSCPGSRQFLAWLDADVSLQRADELFDHAASCPQCGAALAEVEANLAELAPVIKLLEGQHPTRVEAECDQAVALAEQFGVAQLAWSLAEQAPARLREYRLLEKLGQGGMGEVYRAVHSNLERVVALKILARSRLANAVAITRFRREVRAAGLLDHPAIVRATDAGEVDGTHFLVMEYVEGFNLSQLVRRIGPLPWADACELIRQAAGGLEHAHARGLIHRDIKPSNLMLAKQGQLKILDLGLALWQHESPCDPQLTSSGQIMGTTEYMAPEQFDNSHAVDTRADIYSLGCVLFQLLTGQPPFPRLTYDSTYRLMKAHMHEPLPSLSALRPDLPSALVGMLEKMLAKAPADRFRTPADVATALTPFAQGSNPADLIERAHRASEPMPAADAPLANLVTPAWLSLADIQTSDGLQAKPTVRGSADVTPVVHEDPADPRGMRSVASILGTSPANRWTGMTVASLIAIVYFFAADRSNPRHDGISTATSILPPAGSTDVRPVDSDISSGAAAQQSAAPSPVVAAGNRASSAASTAPTIDQPPPASENDLEREVALWALKAGGRVTIIPGGLIEQGESLPARPFRVQTLHVFAHVTDEDVQRLRGLEDLQGVELLKNRVTDVAAEHLGAISSLRWLFLGRTRITDAGLPKLSGLTHLASLGLEFTAISDEGFQQLEQLPALRDLRLDGTAVTDASLEHLLNFPALVRLNLYQTKISSAGLSHLVDLPKLNYLNVQDTGIDDSAVPLLGRLRQLKELNIKQTSISTEGVEDLRQTLPTCRIEY